MGLEKNKIYNIDCMEGLKLLDDNSVDLIITSPPYNKAGLNGKTKRTSNCIWNKTIDYNEDCNVDDMDEVTYQQWQVDFLNECKRVLKEDGSLFYNHKMRYANNRAIFPGEWISKSDLILRQMIVWNRTSGPNMDKCRFIPVTEYIFWLTKNQKRPRFTRDTEAKFQTDVWTFIADRKNNHPAPFPIELPDNIITSVAQGEKITVLDPFMGSGTVALSALKHDCDWIGFEKFPEYIEMANRRLAEI